MYIYIHHWWIIDALFYVQTECTLGYTNIQKYMSNSSYFFPCFMVDCCILNIQEDTNARRILIGLTDLIGFEDVRTKSRGPYDIIRNGDSISSFIYVGVVAVNQRCTYTTVPRRLQ